MKRKMTFLPVLLGAVGFICAALVYLYILFLPSTPIVTGVLIITFTSIITLGIGQIVLGRDVKTLLGLRKRLMISAGLFFLAISLFGLYSSLVFGLWTLDSLSALEVFGGLSFAYIVFLVTLPSENSLSGWRKRFRTFVILCAFICFSLAVRVFFVLDVQDCEVNGGHAIAKSWAGGSITILCEFPPGTQQSSLPYEFRDWLHLFP